MLERGECGLSPEDEESAFRAVQYYKNSQRHFDELSARAAIAKMFYFVGESEKAFAPFFDYDEARELYDSVADRLPGYNFWDFAVALNLIYSNHIDVIKGWTRDKAKLGKRITELVVTFLIDEDSNHPFDKIWWYVNG